MMVAGACNPLNLEFCWSVASLRLPASLNHSDISPLRVNVYGRATQARAVGAALYNAVAFRLALRLE